MKYINRYTKYSFLILMIFSLLACNNNNEKAEETETSKEKKETEHVEEAMLTQNQFESLGIKVDTLSKRNMSGFISANGQLEVPPQSEATVTTVIGANIAKILVIEGDQVSKGETIAYVTHPDIIEIQTQYLNAISEMKLQEREFSRQKHLYEEGVGSGETFQRTEAALESSRSHVKGLRSKLQLLNLNPKTIEKGNIIQQIPIRAPLEGAIEKVNVQTGQFVASQTSMFQIVNTDHVHADLMVFEKDVAKIKVGQKVEFTVASNPGEEIEARIISISKTFEQNPKAVHVHAEINDKPENLIPGMYVKGRINVEDVQSLALPEDAIFRSGESYYAFTAQEEGEDWSMRPVEIIKGEVVNGWVSVKLMEDLPKATRFVQNNAYYLDAQMNKGEGGHSH
ncbi:membrane fusion protein, cobalt-zinc-cadmium efflux system [Salegentibacter holothuriorum]|uniref:Membrane fusion protein, cobalt-zinc-cadmium efflux system n=1 Tax=Salegentibacter holothuriorum TaxID=241145 RepID=A0A1T5D0Q7_9FLAO|nr:efflux RND transporter periplasmic adaptor subunit [Salegentibacter holothuriorum]SKB65161.1 membrane fusion protein, cobalt-zinc-cadmium efflux system [Salegentibacter holothuriorum]